MKRKQLKILRLQSMVHTGVLFASMAAILGGLGWMAAGLAGLKAAVVLTVLSIVLTPHLPAHLVMKAFRAQFLPPGHGPELYTLARELASRAGLDHVPRLYYLPSRNLNAFAAGTRKDPAVCISRGLLEILDRNEITGILGHEIAHIRNNDLLVMGAAAVFGRVIHLLSLAGQFLVILSLPLILGGMIQVPLAPLFFLVLAPSFGLFLHLALSRIREYHADLESAELTGNPRALASALAKLDAFQRQSGPRFPDPAGNLLNTHPPARERIRRLMSLTGPARNMDRSSPRSSEWFQDLAWKP